MFLSNSLRRHWTRSVFALFVLFYLPAALLLVGCKQEPVVNLNGTWSYVNTSNPTYNYDVIINTSAKTIVYTGNYEGQIANSPDYTAANGVLIVKFTKYADWGSAPSATHDNVGKFGALYWTEQTVSSVKLADAYNADYSLAAFDTLAAAQSAFEPAADKVGTYVSSWSGIAPLTKK